MNFLCQIGIFLDNKKERLQSAMLTSSKIQLCCISIFCGIFALPIEGAVS